MTDSPASPEAPLSVPDAIVQRRSVRHFSDRPVPDELVQQLVELTVKAPSSWNFQPWRIVVVTDPDQRLALKAACYNQAQVGEAPVVFVFAISHDGWRQHLEDVIRIAQDKDAWDDQYAKIMRTVAVSAQEGLGDRLREYNTKDALIAATHTTLAAEALGLGTSMMNGYSERHVKAVIGAEEDDDIGVSLVLAVGYPSRRGGNPGRLPLSRTIFDGRLDRPWHD